MLLTLLATGVELFLQVAERLIGQALLVAQCFRQTFHGLLARRLLTLPALPLRDLHVLHQTLQFLKRLLRLGHAALLHQFLDAVHHGLQVILTHLHATFCHLLIVLEGAVAHVLLGQLVHVILRGVPQFLHQLGDFLVRGAVLHRLRQPLLRALQPLKRIVQVTVFQQQGKVPQCLRDIVALL